MQLSPTVVLERRGDVALLWTENPPVNAISETVRHGLYQGLKEIEADSQIKAGVLICRGASFFSGADITEFGQAERPPTWLEFDRCLDLCTKPIIAAIHTRAFGGGLEVALACQYRLATRGAVFAFPEVSLGVIPGGGGTQRFPRLAGFPAALDVIPSGRVFDSDEARAFGVIDRVAQGPLLAEAVAFAREIIAQQPDPAHLPRARSRDEAVEAARATPEIFAAAREHAAKRYRGLTARQRSIDAIENALSIPFEQALLAEFAIFETCVQTAEHRALSHMFFAEREARKVPDLAKETVPRKIDGVAVIGGGTMGRGIALAVAESGLPVKLIEVSAAALEPAIAYCRKEIGAARAKGRVSDAKADAMLGSISGAVGLAEIRDSNLIIEAVFEDMEIKKRVFAELDRVAAPGAILASNTSSLDIDEIAGVTRRPGDVIGLHFFSPANIMSLLEIVRGERTAPETLATGLAIAKLLNKQPVVARVCDGFVTNRVFDPYWREAEFLVEEGASPYEVDKALCQFGMPMGPFALGDLVGLDVGQLIRKRQRQKLPRGVRFATIEDDLVAAGRLGQKNGAGWYRYDAGVRSGTADPQIEMLIDSYRRRTGFRPRRFTADEIVERCIYSVINEGARTLEKGIAIRSSDIDVAAVHGYGFPRWRGGPMQYADETSLDVIAAAIERLNAEHGYWWQPAPGLLKRAAAGLRFAGN